MKIQPNENFTQLGMGYGRPSLDKTKVYDAIPAKNQPDWKEKGKVFVFFNDDKDEPTILLDKFDYIVVKP